VGVVSVNGTKSVSPTQSTTYTLTATGDGGTVTCAKPVTVIPTPSAPTCTLDSNLTNLIVGQSVTLTWSTAHATSAVIDQSVGAVSLSGTRSVSPTTTKTYTLTATGEGGVATCVKTITVEPRPEPLTCDAFTASPGTLNTAGTTTLTWSTSNATNVSINNGVGTVAGDDSKSVYVGSNTIFVLTATRGSETVSCQTPVTIVPVVPVPTCDAFTANPTSVTKGGTAILSWSTSNATNVSINQGVGNVNPDATANVTVNANTTYTLTATNGKATSSCQTTVTIKSSGGGGGGSSSPSCKLTASDTRISSGEKVTLTWKNLRTNEILLKDNRGTILADSENNSKINEDEGSVVVTPTKSTSYVLTVYRGSSKRECSVDVQIGNVSVSSTRSQTPLVAGISLTKVPYTGFDAGPSLTSLFYLLLILWGLAVAYVLVLRKDSVLGVTFPKTQTAAVPQIPHIHVAPTVKEPIVIAQKPIVASAPAPAAPRGLLVATRNAAVGYEAFYEMSTTEENEMEEIVETVPERDDSADMETLEARAHDAHILISSDALRFIMGQSPKLEERIEVLDMVIDVAKSTYPKEDGWVIVNKERILGLLK